MYEVDKKRMRSFLNGESRYEYQKKKNKDIWWNIALFTICFVSFPLGLLIGFLNDRTD